MVIIIIIIIISFFSEKINLKLIIFLFEISYNKIIFIILSKVGDHSRGWPEGSLFDSLLHQGVGEGATPFPGLLHFTLDPYLTMLSVKQGGIKYHFLSLWYDPTWDWTQVSRAIGEHSNRLANVVKMIIDNGNNN